MYFIDTNKYCNAFLILVEAIGSICYINTTKRIVS